MVVLIFFDLFYKEIVWFIKHPLMNCVHMWSANHVYWQNCQDMKNATQQFNCGGADCIYCFTVKYIQAIRVL